MLLCVHHKQVKVGPEGLAEARPAGRAGVHVVHPARKACPGSQVLSQAAAPAHPDATIPTLGSSRGGLGLRAAPCTPVLPNLGAATSARHEACTSPAPNRDRAKARVPGWAGPGPLLASALTHWRPQEQNNEEIITHSTET